jgi:hypothetical protein
MPSIQYEGKWIEDMKKKGMSLILMDMTPLPHSIYRLGTTF